MPNPNPNTARIENNVEPIQIFIHTKVVIRLPVAGKITGYRFQFSITGYRLPTFFLHIMQFSASASSHTLAQVNKDRPTLDPDILTPSDGSVLLVQVYPVFDCRVCSSPLPASGRHSWERRGGEEVQTGRPAWMRLRPRVTARHFF